MDNIEVKEIAKKLLSKNYITFIEFSWILKMCMRGDRTAVDKATDVLIRECLNEHLTGDDIIVLADAAEKALKQEGLIQMLADIANNSHEEPQKYNNFNSSQIKCKYGIVFPE